MTPPEESVREASRPVDDDEGQHPAVRELHARRHLVRTEMGGQKGLERVRAEGRHTVRERIDLLVDEGSFLEKGTFVLSDRPEDRDVTAGDGKVGGHARINGRHVTVVGDDATVKRGSTALMGHRRKRRLFEQALRSGQPFIHLAESAGARIPDMLGAKGATELPSDLPVSRRQRQIPMVSVIHGQTYGGSSFLAAHSDFVVQVKGSSLSITSPRLILAATGERVTVDELGGVDVHGQITGQVDAIAEDDDQAMEVVREFLSYLPQNAWTVPDRRPAPDLLPPDEALAGMVPARLNRAYDMRKVLRSLSDDGQFFEIQPMFGRGLLTGLMRLGGHSVGVMASQPMVMAGVLDPAACDKATRLVCLCDAYNLPIVFLQDVPGFMVGKAVEHQRMLAKAIMFEQALALTTVPKLTVVLRKSYGLARRALGGVLELVDGLYCWPGARFGVMDHRAGARVVNEGGGSQAPAGPGAAEDSPFADVDFGAFGPAERMRFDEVIDPADTRNVLVADLDRLVATGLDPRRPKPLTAWPTRW